MAELITTNFYEYVMDLIETAENSIYISTYTLTPPSMANNGGLKNIYQALRVKVAYGVEVKMLADGGGSSRPIRSSNQKAKLELSLMNIRAKLSHVQGRHHAKFIIIDGKGVLLGSHNLSDNAFTQNFETSLFTTDKATAEALSFIFISRWNAVCV